MKKQLLISAMLISGAFAAWAAEPAHLTSSPYQGAEIQTGGSYYLYNVETGTWLDGNDMIPYAWSATSILNKIGMDIRLDKPAGFVGYSIFCYYRNNGTLRANDSESNFQFGMDGGGDSSDWIIEPKEGSVPNAYTIRVEALDGTISTPYHLGANWMDDYNCYVPTRDLDGTGLSTWQFVTREERIAKMVEEAKANPEGADATWLIPNHSMTYNNIRDDEGWKGTTGIFDHVKFEDQNWVCEGDFRGFVAREGWQGIIDKYAVIEGLPEGSYDFSIHAYYREGSPWETGKTSGPFNNKAWYYAGASSALIMNLFDQTSPVLDRQKGYTDEVNGVYFATYGSGVAFHYGFFKNGPLSANVSSTGKLVIGLWKNEIIPQDSFAFKQMTLTYKTAKVNENTAALKERLSALIAEGDKYASAEGLAEAVNAAKPALNGSGSDMMAAIRELSPLVAQHREAAEILDIFTRTKALCPAGTDVSKAQELFDAAQNKDEKWQAINTLRGIRRRAESKRLADIHTGASQLEEGKMFYLYNVGQKQFMDAGGEWAVHPILDIPGAEFTPYQVDAQTGLTCKISTNVRASETNHWFADWGSMDADNSCLWAFDPVSGQENVFTMYQASSAEKGHVIFYEHAAAWGTTCQSTQCERAVDYKVNESTVDKTDPNAWWKIVTREERDAMIEKASLTNPVDVSYHIANPGFHHYVNNCNPDAWSIKGGKLAMGQIGNYLGATCEITDIEPGEFELFQEIPAGELPYGVYVIECNGYYRDGNLDAIHPVNMFTNDPESTVQLCNILDGADKAPGEGVKVEKDGKTYEIPDNFEQTVAFCRAGAYRNRIVTNFQKDPDDIEEPSFWIGLELPADGNETPNAGGTISLDDVRLTYYGKNTTVDAVKEALEAGVNDIFTEEPAAAAADNRIFNLQGIQVANPTVPGIYIRNGKKFIVR